MIEEKDRQLLLKDLCARLPYGVKVNVWEYQYAETLVGLDVNKQTFNLEHSIGEQIFSRHYDLIIKPYLRPMPSMTEQEKEIYETFVEYWEYDTGSLNGHYEYNYVEIDKINDFVDWLNAHHFDYRGLIDKGLALEAPEGIYKIE